MTRSEGQVEDAAEGAIEAEARSAAPRKAPRDARIEALRIVAIAAIAVFHAFQTWFSAATDGTLPVGAPTLAALGCVSLLGAYGNHVFFAISGLFLIPGAARASRKPGYWDDQARRTARRALTIGVTVALYAAVSLAVSAWVTPVAGVSLGETAWLVGGLEFIWVYLVLVCLAPVMGWVWARVRRPGAIVSALAVIVFVVNAYIAFVSPGEEVRGLLEWRKLMSAASYLVAFLAGGALAETRRTHARGALIACASVAVAIELAGALAGDGRLLASLSFKSTSLLSFLLAMASVAAASVPRPAAPETRAGALARRLAPSILGYYVVQSMLTPLWRPFLEKVCAASLVAGGEAALLAAGTMTSLVLLALALAVDQVVRIPLLRALRLA